MSAQALDFPVALKLAGKPVLLVGGGKIAEGRLRQLLEAGARVHVVSPEVTEGIRQLAGGSGVRLSLRPYAPEDCAGTFLVFTATSSSAVNRAVVADARARGILANAADVPELCDFYVPSIGRRGTVTIAVSTGGLAPGLARAIRQRVMASVGPEYGTLARLLGRLRRRIPGGPRRAAQLQALLDGDAAGLIARGDRRGLWQLIRQVLSSPPAPPREEASVPGGAP